MREASAGAWGDFAGGFAIKQGQTKRKALVESRIKKLALLQD
jgi:hypothetical protein